MFHRGPMLNCVSLISYPAGHLVLTFLCSHGPHVALHIDCILVCVFSLTFSISKWNMIDEVSIAVVHHSLDLLSKLGPCHSDQWYHVVPIELAWTRGLRGKNRRERARDQPWCLAHREIESRMERVSIKEMGNLCTSCDSSGGLSIDQCHIGMLCLFRPTVIVSLMFLHCWDEEDVQRLVWGGVIMRHRDEQWRVFQTCPSGSYLRMFPADNRDEGEGGRSRRSSVEVVQKDN